MQATFGCLCVTKSRQKEEGRPWVSKLCREHAGALHAPCLPCSQQAAHLALPALLSIYTPVWPDGFLLESMLIDWSVAGLIF